MSAMVRQRRKVRSRVSWTRSSAASRLPVRARAPRNNAPEWAVTKDWKSSPGSSPADVESDLPCRLGRLVRLASESSEFHLAARATLLLPACPPLSVEWPFLLHHFFETCVT